MDMYSRIGDVKHAGEAYQTIQRNFEVRGEVLKKQGKEIRIQTDDGTRMDILLKKDMDVKSGQTTVINRKDIESIKVVSKEQETEELKEEDKEKKQLQEKNVRDTPENREALKSLNRFGVDPTKENIEKLASLKQMLDNMKGYLSLDVIAELRSRGLNVDEMSLVDLDKVVKEIKALDREDLSRSISRKDLVSPISNKEAQAIAKELYGSEMGKDILDSIKALKRIGVEPTKDKVDELHDIFSKLYNIQEVDTKTISDAMDSGEEISIDLLYKLKNYIRSSSLEVSTGATTYRQPIKGLSEKDLTAMEGEIRGLLKELGLSEEYLPLAKELLASGKDMSPDALVDIQSLRDALADLQKMMDKDTAALLVDKGMDILGQDIRALLEMVKELKAENPDFQVEALTEVEQENATFLMNMIKNLSSSKLLSENRSLANLIGRKPKEQLEELLFGQGKREVTLLSKQEITVLRTSAIIHSIKDISSFSVDYSRRDISLSYLALRGGLLTKEMPEDRVLKGLSFVDPNPIKQGTTELKNQLLFDHYQSLRSSLRAGHIYAMVRDGIDPLKTDIRVMNSYVETYRASYGKYSMDGLTGFDREKLTIDMLKSGATWNLKTLAQNMELSRSKSGLTEKIEKLVEESEQRNFKEVRESLRSVVQTLSQMDRGSKQEYQQDLTFMYQKLKATEEMVKVSPRQDREVFERHLREMAESIRDSAKTAKTDNMIQIPLFMNNEGSNANLFARSNKKNKKGIDPEDMSVLLDLNMKSLGKVGFYLKVDHKDIGIKISTSDSSADLLKEQLESLSNLFAGAGYNLKEVQLTSEQSGANISFVEEGATLPIATGLDVRV